MEIAKYAEIKVTAKLQLQLLCGLDPNSIELDVNHITLGLGHTVYRSRFAWPGKVVV